MHPLDDIEAITGSRARSLRGALVNSGNPRVAECPDSISEVVAAFYALSECGRLFHWRFGEVRELDLRADGCFEIWAQGERWFVLQRTLQDRLFPDRPIEVQGAIDWDSYDPDGPIPGFGLYDDPLREREKPGDSVIVPRAQAPYSALESAERLWWGD